MGWGRYQQREGHPHPHTPHQHTQLSVDKNTWNDKNLLIVFASASVNESDEQEADRNILSFHLLKVAKVPDIPMR